MTNFLSIGGPITIHNPKIYHHKTQFFQPILNIWILKSLVGNDRL